MGINDRDYARDEPQGFNLGGIHWTGVGIVIVLNVVVYLVDLMTTDHGRGEFLPDSPLQNFAGLRSDALVHPWHLWQLLTYGWLHSQLSFGHLLFNMLGVLFFGGIAEGVLGKKRFLQFYISSLILAGFGWLIMRMVFPDSRFLLGREGHLIGASGGAVALLIYVAWVMPYYTINIYGIFPLKLWIIAVFYVLADFSGMIQSRDNVAHSAHLVGALSGTIFYHYRWCLFDLVPSRLLSWVSRKMKIRKRGFKVHRPSDDDDDFDSPAERSMSDRVDAILEKMSRVGVEGLTQEERDYLASASRKLRARRGK